MSYESILHTEDSNMTVHDTKIKALKSVVKLRVN